MGLELRKLGKLMDIDLNGGPNSILRRKKGRRPRERDEDAIPSPSLSSRMPLAYWEPEAFAERLVSEFRQRLRFENAGFPRRG